MENRKSRLHHYSQKQFRLITLGINDFMVSKLKLIYIYILASFDVFTLFPSMLLNRRFIAEFDANLVFHQALQALVEINNQSV